MPFTGADNLDRSIDKTNAWLAEIASEFGASAQMRSAATWRPATPEDRSEQARQTGGVTSEWADCGSAAGG